MTVACPPPQGVVLAVLLRVISMHTFPRSRNSFLLPIRDSKHTFMGAPLFMGNEFRLPTGFSIPMHRSHLSEYLVLPSGPLKETAFPFTPTTPFSNIAQNPAPGLFSSSDVKNSLPRVRNGERNRISIHLYHPFSNIAQNPARGLFSSSAEVKNSFPRVRIGESIFISQAVNNISGYVDAFLDRPYNNQKDLYQYFLLHMKSSGEMELFV
ncbi:hypothetical protein CDAR_424161 [Caerostris darwini]|uniref:Uncharacterized protein n=1 Tax=Caerostris darwini TaxID=1538125 RepID=A0AAV4T5H9_9ARAC|nr:hypothetical protein CDAR_424161 [Caerostris darwini]